MQAAKFRKRSTHSQLGSLHSQLDCHKRTAPQPRVTRDRESRDRSDNIYLFLLPTKGADTREPEPGTEAPTSQYNTERHTPHAARAGRQTTEQRSAAHEHPLGPGRDTGDEESFVLTDSFLMVSTTASAVFRRAATTDGRLYPV